MLETSLGCIFVFSFGSNLYILMFFFFQYASSRKLGTLSKVQCYCWKTNFFCDGKIMAMSIIEGGPKSAILSKDVYKFTTSEKLLSPKEFNFDD